MKRILLLTFFLFTFAVSQEQPPASWQSFGIGGGGALFSPAINPANHNEIYMSCDMSQLFHSRDNGASWTTVNYKVITGGHDCCVQFTSDTSIRYSVDYTSSNGIDYIRPVKSTNGGSTWQVLPGNPYPALPNGNLLRLFADYDHPDNLVLADYGTIYFSADGGNSFHQIHTCLSNGAGNHIAGVFFDDLKIYIGTNDGLLFSSDGGQTFSNMTTTGIPSSEKILSFAGAKQNGTLRFSCLTATNVWAGYQYGSNYWNAMKGIYFMDNASGTWISQVTGIKTGTDFPVFVGMAANNIDVAYLAGGSSTGDPIVMKSTGNGPWTSIFNTINNENIYTGWCGYGGDRGWGYAEAPFGFTVARDDENTVMFTDYGFAHVTADGGDSWDQQYINTADRNPMGSATPREKKYRGIGLENTSCWQMIWTDSLHIFSGYSDINGIMSDDKGQQWKFIPDLTQNTVYRILRHPGGNLYAATSGIHDLFQSTRIYDAQIDGGIGAVWYSTDNGSSFSLLHNFNHPVIWIALDPGNPNRMVASVLHSNKTTIGGIYVTDNLDTGPSATWTKLPNPPRANGHPFNINVLSNGDLVVSFSARKPTTNSAFTDSSGVFLYSSSAGSWSDRSDPNMRFWTQDIVVDPNDTSESTWYGCVFEGWGTPGIFGTGGLFKTTDQGLTWKRINDNFRVNSVAINPFNPNELYMTTETDGLWLCPDATSSNPSFVQQEAYPFRHPVRVFYNPNTNQEIWITSFGNGIQKGTSGAPSGIQPPLTEFPGSVMIWPNPFRDVVHVKIGEPCPGYRYTFRLFDQKGSLILQTRLNTQMNVIRIGEDIAAGSYFFEIRNGISVILSGKLIKQ